MFEVGEPLYDPVLSFDGFELLPLVGVEETVIVGQVSVLADESDDLRFDSEGIVANNDGCVFLI